MNRKRIFTIVKRSVTIVLVLIVLLVLTGVIYMQQPQFGKAPSGERLAKIERSPNYKDGHFRNTVEKPTISEGYSIAGETYKTLFEKIPRRSPADSLPSVKTNLHALSADSNLVIWFGHSSCFIQLNGRRFLIDPVFSGNASPIPGSVKAYKGSDLYAATDMPEIDFLLISHDHYDHLDYETVKALHGKVKHVVCGLGVGADFAYWGYPPEKIHELDWHSKLSIDPQITIYGEPTHHDAGRGFIRAKTLWMSYVIQSPGMKIFISGDGGYGPHFKEIGNRFGPFDFAIMEDGQYDKAWESVHNLPEQVVQATLDLKARRMMPVHHSKFTLGKHAWDEPLIKVTALSALQPYVLSTPRIGEIVNLDNPAQTFPQWWKGIH